MWVEMVDLARGVAASAAVFLVGSWRIDDAEEPKKKGGLMDRLAKMQEQAKALEEMKRHSKAQQHQQRQRREKSKAGPGKGKRRR